MSDLVLTIKAAFIDAAKESYLQTLLPGYTSKYEDDELIELHRRGYSRRTVSQADIQNAVLLDELCGRTMPGDAAKEAAKTAGARKIAAAVFHEVGKLPRYYRSYSSHLRDARSITQLCMRAL
jgi:hypothetical protein